MKMRFEIPALKEVSKDEFIFHWGKKYSYALESLYHDNIGKKLTVETVKNLFCWKAGRKEKVPRPERLKIYMAALPEIQKLKLRSHTDGEKYLKTFVGGGAIWNIFWLHCLQPDLFPIFDQHTYRAMKQIKDGNQSEIPNKDKTKIYFEEYIPFIFSLVKKPTRGQLKKLDESLFKYGKFLKKLL